MERKVLQKFYKGESERGEGRGEGEGNPIEGEGNGRIVGACGHCLGRENRDWEEIDGGDGGILEDERAGDAEEREGKMRRERGREGEREEKMGVRGGEEEEEEKRE